MRKLIFQDPKVAGRLMGDPKVVRVPACSVIVDAWVYAP